MTLETVEKALVYVGCTVKDVHADITGIIIGVDTTRKSIIIHRNDERGWEIEGSGDDCIIEDYNTGWYASPTSLEPLEEPNDLSILAKTIMFVRQFYHVEKLSNKNREGVAYSYTYNRHYESPLLGFNTIQNASIFNNKFGDLMKAYINLEKR